MTSAEETIKENRTEDSESCEDDITVNVDHVTEIKMYSCHLCHKSYMLNNCLHKHLQNKCLRAKCSVKTSEKLRTKLLINVEAITTITFSYVQLSVINNQSEEFKFRD